MKKIFLSITLMLFSSLLLSGIVGVKAQNYGYGYYDDNHVYTSNNTNNVYEYTEILKDKNGKEYKIVYKETGQKTTNFTPYTHVMGAPKGRDKKGTYEKRIYHSKTISLSSQFSMKSKIDFGFVSGELGIKLTVGVDTQDSISTISGLGWTYPKNYYRGDMGIFGLKTTAIEFSFSVYAHATKTIIEHGASGKQTKRTVETNEFNTYPLKTGKFWSHDSIGLIGIFVFDSKHYGQVINSINNNKFSPYMSYCDY